MNYILLFHPNSVTSSILTLYIHKEKPTSTIFHPSSTIQAIQLLGYLEKQKPSLSMQQEVCFVVDLNLPSLEGYLFLATLHKYDYSCSVKVYVFNDEARPEINFPPNLQYQIAGRFNKPLNLEEVSETFIDHSTHYSQKSS